MNVNDTKKVQDNEIFDTANIIIAGVTGAGKSTLINAVFGKDFAATGKGRPVTQEIREYSNPEVPVRIWDSIGFEIGNDNNGVSKTKASITKIKKTIEEQASKEQVDHIHAIWYCINQGGSRYQPTEAEFVKELHSIGVPFIIIVTQCLDDDPEFVDEINKLNLDNGITDVPVIEVLAQDKTIRGGLSIPSFGLDILIDKTLEKLPDFIKGSFIAGQQIKVVLKREECEKIILKYSEMTKTDIWDEISLIKLVTVDKKYKKMTKEVLAVYNQIVSEDGCNQILYGLSKSWTKDLLNWQFNPLSFIKSKKKFKAISEHIKKEGAEGLELVSKDFDYSDEKTMLFTYYGYSIICSAEDIWDLIKEKKIQNLESVVIPLIKEKIQYYMSGGRRK